MSWLGRSPLRSSFTKHRSRDSPPKDADPIACYDSFRKHWQQSFDIISQSLPPKGVPSQDDVLGVVNHVDQMITLLLLELRDSNQIKHQNQRFPQRDLVVPAQLSSHSYSCLEYLLSENLLDKLYEWSTYTGKYGDAVRLEQLKLYELIISHDSTLLAHEPVTRPLLRLLDECAKDIMLVEVQKKLVILLNHVCVALVINVELLGLFFRPAATGKNRFIIFSLLIPYLYQEGEVGRQARDAMVLCMTLSKKNDEIGNFIAEESHICPHLAMGLSGLYSRLPRTLEIENQDWHRLTVDDINNLPPLTQVINCLEFCNELAVAGHPLVQKQLLEFLYRGFLVPVIGPALLQESIGLTIEELDSPMYRTSVDELIAATAYFDLFLRTVTEPGLLRSMIKFLLEENFDDNRILDHLIWRISSTRSTLSLVTLALFETLVDLNCEDVLLELCLGALAPCSHVMLSQRRRLLRDLDPFGRCAERFLSLAPNCCNAAVSSIFMNVSSPSTSPNLMRHAVTNTSTSSAQQRQSHKNAKLPLVTAETLYSNYFAYLRDARQKIATCQSACSSWSRKYEDEEEEGDYEEEELDNADDTDVENGNYDDEFYEDDEEESNINNNASKRISYNSNEDVAVRKNSTDEKVNRIIASFSDRPAPTVEKESNSKSFEPSSKLTLAEREKLEADIAELLSESFDNLKSDNDNFEMYKNGHNVPEIKSPMSQTEESNATMSSLQMSLSGGESSGYESFAFKGSSESTPINEDYDDDGCSESKIISDHTTVKSEPTSESQQSSGCPRKIIQDLKNRRRSSQTRRKRLLRRNAVSKDSSKQETVDGKPPSVGIFLDTVLKKLECMMENNVYVNLHLTGLISRLAIYPQPLLQSFLLNHSLVFQPSIKSLFQVLVSLKRKIDDFIAKQPEDSISVLVEQARVFLISRENRLVNARKNVLEAAAQFPSPKKNHAGADVSLNSSSTSMPTVRALESKRRSLTSSLTQIFRKSTSIELQNTSSDSMNNDSFSYIAEEETSNGNTSRNNDPSFWESPNKVNKVQNVVLCAVIIDEWLKELAAITQEHTIVSWFSAAAASESSVN